MRADLVDNPCASSGVSRRGYNRDGFVAGLPRFGVESPRREEGGETDAGTWLWPGGWGRPAGLAIFLTGLGIVFSGFGLFIAGVARLNQSKIAKAEYELKERQRYERAPAPREGGWQ